MHDALRVEDPQTILFSNWRSAPKKPERLISLDPKGIKTRSSNTDEQRGRNEQASIGKEADFISMYERYGGYRF
jgi:hypothetical protein